MRKSVAIPRESIAPATTTRARQGGPLNFLEVGNIKESRNFKDKGIFTPAAHSLLAFLEENGFPQQISMKNLEQPTTALVAQIFKFLLNRISPSFDIGQGRIEEEFPKVMIDLHYPFSLKKSHVQSATTPSGWPVVFGALIWLYENLDDVSENLKQRDGRSWREYHGKLYDGFLCMKPVSTAVVEDMRRVLADEAKAKKNKQLHSVGKVESLQSQMVDLEARDNELTNLQLKINEDNAEIQSYRLEVEKKRANLACLEQREEQVVRRMTSAETELNDTSLALEKLKDAIANQAVNKDVICTTRNAVTKLSLEIQDMEQEIDQCRMLSDDTLQDITSAKVPVDDLLVRFRSIVNQLLGQLSRLNISIDPGSLGMSLPNNPTEQLHHFKNTIKPASIELSDTLNEENVSAKRRLREFAVAKNQLNSDQGHIDRELQFLESQNKRLIEEERQFVEREEKRLYEWRSQAEELAAKRRAHMSELDARNSDVRHRIISMDKEIENENMVLADRARTYEQVLTHISTTATDAYKPVTMHFNRMLNVIREHQKREFELLRRGYEIANAHPLLRQSLNEVITSRNSKS